MKITECWLGEAIYWRIRPSDPDLLPLTGLPGTSFLNPLLYDQLPTTGDRERNQRPVFWLADDAWFQSRRLVLVDAPRSGAPNRETLFRFVEDLLAQIRLISGQATISTSLTAAVSPAGEIPVPPRPTPFPEMEWMVAASYLIDWAVTMEAVEKADRDAGGPIPLPHGILLDAVEAVARRDYRRALLYSGIAMESVAATVLDRRYDDEHGRNDPRLRFRTIGGSHEMEDDVVYKFLRQQAKFAHLLHEVPLYLTNRSLADDAPALYQKALRLYRTRNKLVHVGEAPESGAFFPVTTTGVSEGLDTAADVFRWFGEASTIVNPLRTRMVKSAEFR